MPKKDLSKFKLEQELERLSWEFILAEKELEDNESEDKIEEDFLELEEETDNLSPPERLKNNYDSAVDSFYSSYDSSINNLNRDSGIIFDEAKLQNTKITQWNKAPRLRESAAKKVFTKFINIIFTPFRLIALIFYYLGKFIYKAIFFFVNFFYKLIRNIVVVIWQIILAFRHSFVYLFGDFSWFKSGKAKIKELATTKTKSKIKVSKKAFPFLAIKFPSRLKPIGTFIIIALILVLPLQGYLIYHKAQVLKGKVLGASEAGITDLKQAGLSSQSFDFTSASKYFLSAQQEFSSAKDSINTLGALTNSIASLIPDVSLGKKLLDIAEESAQIGGHLTQVALVWNQILGQIDHVDELNPGAKEIINWPGAASEFDLALNKAYNIQTKLNEIDLTNSQFADHSQEFASLKNQFPQILNYLQESKDLFQIISYLLGVDEPRRLMLVFQNNSEMRPTGGFMGSYAIIDVKDGKIQNLDVPGGGFYDLKGSLSVAVDSPYPFHLFSSIWQPWNANWFPDWPASAQKIMWFYDKSGGSSVDAVIAFTPNILEKLLDLTGEIDMPEYETTVTSENFVKIAQVEVEFDYDKEENKPKKFIGDLMPIILDKAFALKDEKLFDLWQIVSSSLKQKHLLIYLNNDDLQTKVADFGWAGDVLDTSSDYLSIISTNIAGGKTDRVVEGRVYHSAELSATGEVIDTVTLIKEHKGNTDDIFESQVNTDYIRFYVPQGSELISAVGFDPRPTNRIFQEGGDEIIVDSDLSRLETNLQIDKTSGTRITDEFGKTVFANWLVVAPGESKSVTLKYKLPWQIIPAKEEVEISLWQLIKQYFTGDRAAVAKDKQLYSLLVQKQSGNDNLTFHSKFMYNSDWQIADYLPQSDKLKIESDFVNFSSDLKTDQYYGIVLEEK